MEGYILTANGNVLTRIILLVFGLIHLFAAYKHNSWRFYVSPKIYNSFFLVDFAALTAFVVWCCINEPFKDGIILAVIGYALAYTVLFVSWSLLSRITISHTKVYQMLPYIKIYYKGRKAVEGYIMESGRNHAVLVYSDELYDNIKDATLVDVKFKDYTYGEDAVVFEALMEPVKE